VFVLLCREGKAGQTDEARRVGKLRKRFSSRPYKSPFGNLSGAQRDYSSFKHLDNQSCFLLFETALKLFKMALSQTAGNSGNAAFKVRALELQTIFMVANTACRTRRNRWLFGQRISKLQEVYPSVYEIFWS
jgi:hypothetical protein